MISLLQDMKTHKRKLRPTMNKISGARKVNLKLNSKKMNLKKHHVKFMGHVITKDGVKNPTQIK